MDNNNWRPTQGGSEPTIDTGDWRTQLRNESRQRIINKIMDTLKRHLPFSGQEGLPELKRIAIRFEEKIYAAATSQSDYLRRISLKMLSMESKSKSIMANSMPSNFAINNQNPADAGQIKLNVAGSVQEGTNKAGIGGLFRDEKGVWILGFAGRLEHRSPLEAELRAIYRGLTIAIAREFNNFDLESDASLAVMLIIEETSPNCLFHGLVSDIKFMLSKCNALIAYTPSEGNGCADKLAKMGKDMTGEFQLHEIAPELLIDLLLEDMRRIETCRL